MNETRKGQNQFISMDIKTIIDITGAECVCGDPENQMKVSYGFACDLMSDVLTLDADELLLITGLCNTQTIRTAEMSDVKCILFVRGKKATDDMIELAKDNDIVLLETPFSMFRAVGELVKAGIEPLF